MRGIVGADFGIRDAINFCSNFAELAGGACVTGMDTRPSSEMVARAAHAGLMLGSADVRHLGVVPTPVTFREARKAGAGVMITASHNPIIWNGLKFILEGRGINESELPLIAGEGSGRDGGNPGGDAGGRPYGTMINGAQGRPELSGGALHGEAAVSSYIEDAAGVIGHVDGGPRILVDVGGGAAARVAPRLYDRVGCSAKVINSEPNSRGPDPTTDRLDALLSGTSGPRYDIGFAFDLDGDRLVIAVDGKKQSPDVTLGLGVMGALEAGHTDFVLSTDTSLGVERMISSRGGTSIRTKVGEANVVGEMIKRGAHAGGEGSSGGFILPEFNYCRDGILAGGMIAGALKGGAGISEALEELGRYHIIRTKVQADPKEHAAMIGRVSRWMKSECSEVQEFDGTKGILGENSWILVRGSNTEDAIRISSEAEDEAGCSKMVKRATDVMLGR